MFPGMPLGALGTGFMSLGTDGTLDYVNTVFNDYITRSTWWKDYTSLAKDGWHSKRGQGDKLLGTLSDCGY